MVKKFEIVSVNFNKLPDVKVSNELLNIIHRKIKPSLHDVSNKIDKPIIIYGAGTLGKMVIEYFEKLKIKPLFVVDRNFERCNKDSFWKNYEILDPCEIPYISRKLNKIVVCIVTTSYCEIQNWLHTLGFDDIIPFYDVTLSYQDKHPLNNGWLTNLLDNEDIENMKRVINELKDDVSRAHYLQFISWHSIREEWIFKDAPIIHKEKYFIPEIVSILHENEIFVNVGAYDGEFTTKFMNIVNNKFNSIYAFEPDVENVNKFLNHIEKNMDKYKICIIPKALGKCNEEKSFYFGIKCLSQLTELGNKKIHVHKLDDFVVKLTILKIHIEGKEIDVIDGGMKCIIQNRPIIMVTIYHNRKESVEIPLKLMNSLTDYVYYFRLHAWCGTSGILYSIPKERLRIGK